MKKVQLEEKLSDIGVNIDQSGLLEACKLFAKCSEPVTEKVGKRKDIIQRKYSTNYQNVDVQLVQNGNDFYLTVQYEESEVFNASSDKALEYQSVQCNGYSVKTYIPGKWEDIVREGASVVSPQIMDYMREHFGIKENTKKD